ncbi:MAG TPA: glycoside hydrolase family 9 protein [Terriglobia bacterium]|nr:glycoside hydrolase family 9 protein [Terriglobia bacterium]
MKRRQFISTLASIPVLGAALNAQEGPPVQDPVERMTAPPWPTIALNHLGFRPRAGEKALVVRAIAAPPPTEFTLRDVSQRPFIFTRPLKKVDSDFGPCLVADFTDLERTGLYQITVGPEHSVQFAIEDDVWRRTVPKAVGYYRYQRCGVEVPYVHPVCHLDDARRRDNGEHVDEVGGWHDAGDLRKWMDVTMLNGIALLNLLRNVPQPRPGDATHQQLLDEVRHGNLYFLKMQDTDGKVWADTAGGLNGDNSDNHWTDNIAGTADDRYINTAKRSGTAAVFTTLQALVAQCYAQADSEYARRCLDAGVRAWKAFRRPPKSTSDSAWWAFAACELYRATHDPEYRDQAMLLGRDLLGRQNTAYLGDQRQVRGFWMDGEKPYADIVNSAMPPLALLELMETFPQAGDQGRWKNAVALHIEDYLLPMAARNAYRIIPLGMFLGSPTPETYRPLAGNLTYRYFHPVRQQFWWQGANCHLASNALMLGWFAKHAGTKSGDCVRLAYRQLEWIMGANPFGSCMMTGEGMRNPFPHSRFVGLIPGGIMNGIAGNVEDAPVLDLEYTLNWRTCEYWSPHVAFYIWANSVLDGVSSAA